MRIPGHKDKEYLEAIDTYLPLGAKILEEMASEEGKLVATFKDLVSGHNEALGGLAEAIRDGMDASESKRQAEASFKQAQEELEYVKSPEYHTGLILELQAELDAIPDPEERRRFLVRKRASLEGKIVESKARQKEEEKIVEETTKRVGQTKDNHLKAVKRVEMAENEIYKRALELGETEERALEIATKDHLPGIFEIYDMLTMVYGISTEEEAVQRRSKMRYLLEVKLED